ncbi:hypothetical protein BDQ17DRAFT_1422432 [Cyathus striatus]|nr:hypothetical protein BDQ17DRAFT_1422432 [Cyathus striatus]
MILQLCLWLPDSILPYILKSCHVHVKRAILNFRKLVSHENYQRILDFFYLKPEDLPAFDEFIDSLCIPKIKSWWLHKCQSKWILPTILQSMSHIHPDTWKTTPTTTNTGEGQHYWTTTQTGIKLPLLEAIKIVEKVDRVVSTEVKRAHETAITISRSNTCKHRITRSVKHAASSTKKISIQCMKEAESSELQQEIDTLTNKHKESEEKLRNLRKQLCDVNGTTSKVQQKRHGDSTGRVKTPKIRLEAARAGIAPYPESSSLHVSLSPTAAAPVCSSPMPSVHHSSTPEPVQLSESLYHPPTPEPTQPSLHYPPTPESMQPSSYHLSTPEPQPSVRCPLTPKPSQVQSYMYSHQCLHVPEVFPAVQPRLTTPNDNALSDVANTLHSHTAVTHNNDTDTPTPEFSQFTVTNSYRDPQAALWNDEMSEEVFDNFLAQFPSPKRPL